MDKCGIICEYNPFHNGHLYHIKKTMDIVNSSIVCVMSGDFVLRAEPAVFDKFLRAEMAIRAGADIVLEIPSVHSISGGEIFSYSAIEILSNIKDLKYISLGIETENFDLIEDTVRIQIDESEDFKRELKELLKKGLNYASAYSLATSEQLIKRGYKREECQKNLRGANNILAIEYLKAIKRKGLDIKPIFINRCDKGFNDLSLTPPYASASAIRNLIYEKRDYKDFVPFDFGLSPLDIKAYDAIIRNFLLTRDNKNAKKHNSLNEIILAEKTKNVTYTHIKRKILTDFFNIGKDILNYRGNFFYRLLAIKNSFKNNLKEFFNILIKVKDEQRIEGEIELKIHNIGKATSNLYSVITNQSSDRNKIVKI